MDTLGTCGDMSDIDTDPDVTVAAGGCLAEKGVEDLSAAGGMTGISTCGDKSDIYTAPDVTVAAGGCLAEEGIDVLSAVGGMTGIGGGGGRMNCGLVSGN